MGVLLSIYEYIILDISMVLYKIYNRATELKVKCLLPKKHPMVKYSYSNNNLYSW